MFIVRMVFWLCVVVMFLPAEPMPAGDAGQQLPQLSAAGAYQAAEQAVDDLGGICQRNAHLCNTGQQISDIFMAKARYGAKLLYTYLEDAPAADEQV